MTDTTIIFRDALQTVYGPLDWLPLPDGDIHRFRVPDDKPGTLNGWYVLYLDGIASGAFGSWKAGGTHTWSSREPHNNREAEQVRQRIAQARRQREAEQHKRQLKAANLAQRWWRDARRADPDQAYLIAKAVRPTACASVVTNCWFRCMPVGRWLTCNGPPRTAASASCSVAGSKAPIRH